MKLTDADYKTWRAYNGAVPRELGNLHERMKYVLALAGKVGHEVLGNALWQALFDLECEVSCHKPAAPPYGKRTVEIGKL